MIHKLFDKINKQKNLWGFLLKFFFFVSFILIIFISSFYLFNFITGLLSKTMIPVLNFSINDSVVLDRILLRLYQEKVKIIVTSDNIILVKNDEIARFFRAILIKENLIPSEYFEVSNAEYNFEDFINLNHALENLLTEHIMSINGVDSVKIQIGWQISERFRSNDVPVIVNVFITLNTNISQYRKVIIIDVIKKLVKFISEEIKEENIIIIEKNSFH